MPDPATAIDIISLLSVDSILTEFKSRCLIWTQGMRPYQSALYYALASLYFVFGLHKAILRRSDGLEILIFVAVSVIKILFFQSLMIQGPIWCGNLIASFQFLGSEITNVKALSPGALLNQGTRVALAIFNYDFDKGMLASVAVAFFSSIAAFAVLLSYLAMSAYMLLLLTTSYIVLGPASIVLVFTASSWTIGMLRGYLDYVFNVSLKIFTIYLVIALVRNYGFKVIIGFKTLPTNIALETVLYVTAVSGLLAVLTLMLPKIVASITTGIISFQSEDFITSMKKFSNAAIGTAKTLSSGVKISGKGLAFGTTTFFKANYAASLAASNMLTDLKTKVLSPEKKKTAGIKKLGK